MKKKIVLTFACAIFCVALCACGAQKRPARATDDKSFQKVFSYLEEGEYAKAQEFFDENITGNLEKEDAAWEAFELYKNAVLQDVSSEKLSIDEAKQICEAAYRAGFKAYFENFEIELDDMQNSMICFDSGINYFNSTDYENAYLYLKQVLPQDINYGESLETIYQIAVKTMESESIDELLLSKECLELIESNFDNYVISELENDGQTKLLQLLHNVSLKLAEGLEAQKRTLFAAAEYANTAWYSYQLQTLTDDAQTWLEANMDELNHYANLIREKYVLTDDFSTRYILTDMGIQTLGESPAFKTTHDDYIQLSLLTMSGLDSRAAYGVIDELGNASFGISDSATDYIDWVDLTNNSWRNTGPWNIPIKIFLAGGYDSPNAIILYSNGTMDMYSTDLPSSYQELQNYSDVLDFIAIYERYGSNGSEFAILTKSGYVYRTSGVSWLDLSGWTEMIEITSGHASPAGYSSSSYSIYEDDYLYGLDKNGTIHYVEILDESQSDQMPESGTFTLVEPIVKIAGGAFLTETGLLGSIETTLNDWLVANYSQYRFNSIVKANPVNGHEYGDTIAATTTDGEIMVIDLDDVRNSLLILK